MAPIQLVMHHFGLWRGLLWHPHQGLWNWRLVGAVRARFPGSIAAKLTVKAIILLDTVLLAVQALRRRVSKAGLASVLETPRVPSHIPLLYFDLGTHKEARELSFMMNEILPRYSDNFTAYGFEACRDFWEQARALFTDRTNVQVVHGALCHHTMPAGGRIRLYKGQGDGLEASIYRQNLAEYDEVDALRFSDWLRDNHLELNNSLCLLRMNIEGAELDVIQDLVEHDLAASIDGYFGMWDDVSKIDARRGEDFRALLATHGIAPFTFNGRDFRSRIRTKCIEYDIGTSIHVGLRRIRVAGEGRGGWTHPAGSGHNQGLRLADPPSRFVGEERHVG